MPHSLKSMVASTYVRDVAASRAFYHLLGFRELTSGSAATSAWSYLQQDGHFLLLASTTPPLAIPPLPLLLYLFVDELDALVAALEEAGQPVHRVGHPPHALGGEVKILDPDGNTVLLGQRERSPEQADNADNDSEQHFSLLREAAALVKAGGGVSVSCEIGNSGGTACQEVAEVRLADSWGAPPGRASRTPMRSSSGYPGPSSRRTGRVASRCSVTIVGASRTDQPRASAS